jgi:hypothetical protein
MTTQVLTDELIARRLAERTMTPDPGLLTDILRATETNPQRRPWLRDAWSASWLLLGLLLLLAALAAIAIATAPPPMPPGLQVSVGRPMGGLQLSPDGRWAVPMTGEGHALVSTDPGAPRGADGQPKPVVTWKGHSGGIAWSPDSRYLAWHGTLSPGVVTIYDIEHSDAAPRTISVAGEVPSTALFLGMLWSADGSQILFQTANCPDDCAVPGAMLQALVVDVRSGALDVVSPSLPPGYVSGWAPDGKSLGLLGGLIVDLRGQPIRDLLPAVSDVPSTASMSCVSGPVWSPDGRRIAIINPLTNDSGRLLIFDPGASEARVLAVDACRITGWSPDGERIVFVTGISFATKWVKEGDGGGLQPTGPGSDAWIVRADGGEPQLVKHLDWGEVPILVWSSPGG